MSTPRLEGHDYTGRPVWRTFREDGMVYTRLAPHLIDGQRVTMIELANFYREGVQANVKARRDTKSTGFLDSLMTKLESDARLYADGVYVECILNEWLPEWLERRGYKRDRRHPEDDLAPSYYRLTCS